MVKRIDFKKGKHRYSFYFDDARVLANHLYDLAADPGCNIEVMDLFKVIAYAGEVEAS